MYVFIHSFCFLFRFFITFRFWLYREKAGVLISFRVWRVRLFVCPYLSHVLWYPCSLFAPAVRRDVSCYVVTTSTFFLIVCAACSCLCRLCLCRSLLSVLLPCLCCSLVSVARCPPRYPRFCLIDMMNVHIHAEQPIFLLRSLATCHFIMVALPYVLLLSLCFSAMPHTSVTKKNPVSRIDVHLTTSTPRKVYRNGTLNIFGTGVSVPPS